MAKSESQGSLGEFLLEDGVINAQQLAEAGRRRRARSQSLGQALIEMGVVGEAQKIGSLKKRLDLEVVSLEDFDISPLALGALPRSFCERNMAAGIMRERGSLVVAMEDPSNREAIDEAAELSGLKIEPVIATSRDISAALANYPEKDSEGNVVGMPQKTAAGGAVHKAILIFLAILPLPLFLVSSRIPYIVDALQDFAKFELWLCFLLVWSLWLVAEYEINGLMSGKKN